MRITDLKAPDRIEVSGQVESPPATWGQALGDCRGRAFSGGVDLLLEISRMIRRAGSTSSARYYPQDRRR